MQVFFVKTQKFQKISKYPFTNQVVCAIIYKSSGNRRETGVSPSGKAADSDSVISRVQILPPQPTHTGMGYRVIPGNLFLCHANSAITKGEFWLPVVCGLQKCIFLPLLFLCGTAHIKVATSSNFCFPSLLANMRADPGFGQGCVLARSTVSKNPSIKMYSVFNVLYTVCPSKLSGITC